MRYKYKNTHYIHACVMVKDCTEYIHKQHDDPESFKVVVRDNIAIIYEHTSKDSLALKKLSEWREELVEMLDVY